MVGTVKPEVSDFKSQFGQLVTLRNSSRLSRLAAGKKFRNTCYLRYDKSLVMLWCYVKCVKGLDRQCRFVGE